jgi:pimeloyl-ACP methyl ester carboxylesterase
MFRSKAAKTTEFAGALPTVVRAIILAAAGGFSVSAQTPPNPTPASGGPANIFYGSVLPTAASGPILVFIHGLNGTAADWWLNQVPNTPNPMYSMAYTAGYRTVFVSLNADNSRNNLSWEANGTALKGYLQAISQHFGGARFYLVGHSEGGLDIQAALLNAQYTALDPVIAPMVKGVFTIATPNQGTALADWAFGPGFAISSALGLTTPAVQSLEVATVGPFRAQADPIFASAGIQFYTLGGNIPGPGTNILLDVTSLILRGLTPGPNDGLVPLSSVSLPYSYAMNVGQNGFNHYLMLEGTSSFFAIDSQVKGLEKESQVSQLPNTAFTQSAPGFKKIATGGFGDNSNTFAWSQAWFNHKFYVGTGREVRCVSSASADVQNGTHSYPPKDGSCPADPKDLRLQAEIWQYTPETHSWVRVYQSPATVPIGNDAAGNPVLAALDIAYRGMTVFTEPDGTQALYAAGVTAGEIYGNIPPYTFQTYPPPRILRTTDGVNWAPLPQPPGSFLANISSTAPADANVFGFRSLTSYHGMLFATAGNYFGNGMIIASANPAAGGDAWFAAGPSFDQLPAWDMTVFNDQLYVVGGTITNANGYFVAETNAAGTPPYTFNTVVSQGGTSAPGTKEALSMAVFNNALYVGTDGPTELIRINTDNTWDLIIGAPRSTPQGQKNPLSGIGEYFDNQFNRHFWRLGVVPSGAHAGIYFTTYDYSIQLEQLWEVANLIANDYGTDIYTSPDGINWTAVTTTGFGDGYNYGGRTIETTPFGTSIGMARYIGGTQIWLDQTVLDYNGDGEIDQNDVNMLMARVGQSATGPNDPMDLDQDGQITVLDARKLVTQCTNNGCAVATSLPTILPAPSALASANAMSTSNVQLTWNPVPGAVKYHVYRQTQTGLLDLFPPGGVVITFDGFIKVTIPEDILNGDFNKLCPSSGSANPLCDLIYVIESAALPSNTIGYPSPLVEVGVASSTSYSEVAPTQFQSVYFVRAEDAAGNLSGPSNYIGAPSMAPVP